MSRHLVWLIGLAAALWPAAAEPVDLDIYYETCVIGGPAAFIVVAEDFQDFGAAIRHKLILEIAGIEPGAGEGTAPRFARPPHAGQLNSGPIPVTRFEPPDCTIGERLLEQYPLLRIFPGSP